MSWTELDSNVTQPAQTDLTLTTLLARLVAQLDNLPTQHPHYSLLTSYLNEAKDELPRLLLAKGARAMDLFPTLQNWRWHDLTVNAQNYLPLPERMLYLTDVHISRSNSAYVATTDTLYPLSPWLPADGTDFGTLSPTQTGWPQIYRRAGARVELWPIPSNSPTNYVTGIVVTGMRKDKILSSGSDVLLMPPEMQLLALDLARVIAMEKMGWEEAGEARTSVESRINRLLLPAVPERSNAPMRTRVSGLGGY